MNPIQYLNSMSFWEKKYPEKIWFGSLTHFFCFLGEYILSQTFLKYSALKRVKSFLKDHSYFEAAAFS